MADRPRPRPARLMLLLVLCVLLCLLFELHRFLPGGWPGGAGASGFRRLDVAGGEDPTRVRRPEGWRPDWTPADGVTLSVRGPEATTAERWRVSVGESGAPVGPEAGGDHLRLLDRALGQEGFSLRWPQGVLSHGAPPSDDPLPTWRVALPAAPLAPRLQPQPVVVEVRAAEDGAPLAGAKVRVDGKPTSVPTDAEGRARLPGLKGLTVLEVASDGRLPARVFAHPQSGAPVVVALERPVTLDVALLDPLTRQPAEVEGARLLAADGSVLWELPPQKPGRSTRLQASLPSSALAEARLEVDASGRPRTRTRLEPGASEVLLAEPGRRIEVRARDVNGAATRISGAQVRYDAATPRTGEREDAGVLERRVPDADGVLRVAVPAAGAAEIVVESAEHAPAYLRVDPNDSAGAREVTFEVGLRVPVLVLDLRGRPVREATIVARAVVGGMRVEARATTNAEGRARVGPLPAGAVEVLAHAAGRAWSARAAEAQAPMEAIELRLAPGAPLRLRVETPWGAPLAGVSVAAVPDDDGPADVEPPEPERWTTDASGTLRVADLPLRPYRLRLELAGHASETLYDVTPGPVWYFATLVPQAPPPEAASPRER